MKSRRTILTSAAGVLAAAVFTAPAVAATAPMPCKPLTAGGQNWALLQSGSDCTTTETLISALAKVRVPPGQQYNLADKRYKLTAFKRWQCLATSPPGTKPNRIACARGSARVFGIATP